MLAESGAEQVVGLVLALHYSTMSVGVYLELRRGRAAEHGLPFVGIESWASEPAYVDYLAGVVRTGLADAHAGDEGLFTAHSLPRRILDTADPYTPRSTATATLAADRAGLAADRWSIAWQSAGRTPEPWLEPDLLGVIDELAGFGDVDGVLVCPCGFVADHLEVLYDVDIERADAPTPVDSSSAACPSSTTSSSVMTALARRIVAAGDDMTRRAVVVGGGIAGLTVTERLSATFDPDDVTVELREGTSRGGASDITVRRAPGRRRGRRRLPRPYPRAPPWPSGSASAPTSRRHRRRAPSSGTAACIASPTACCSACPATHRPGDEPLAERDRQQQAAVEPLLPRTSDPADSVGRLIRMRFGDEVHERLVDALVGSIYAADTDRFSLAMVPQLTSLAEGQRSLCSPPGVPAAAQRRPARRCSTPLAGHGVAGDSDRSGVHERRSAPSFRFAGGHRRHRRSALEIDGEAADAVVLATPADAAARLVVDGARAGRAAGAVGACRGRHRHAGRGAAALVRRRHERVPRSQAGPATRHGRLLRLAEVEHRRDGDEVVRASLGRDGLPVDHLDDAVSSTRR